MQNCRPAPPKRAAIAWPVTFRGTTRARHTDQAKRCPEPLSPPGTCSSAPLANCIAALHRQRPDVTLTLVVPEIVVAKRWQRILHNRIAARLRASLIAYDGIIITTVRFHLPR